MIQVLKVRLETPEIPVDLWRRLDGLGVGRGRALEMAGFLAGGLDERRSGKLGACAAWLLFRNYYTKGETKLKAGNFCCLPLLCPVCARLRAAKHARRYMERLAVILAGEGRRIPAMLTLTVKDGERLGDGLEALTRGFSVLTRRGSEARRGKKMRSEFSKVRGGVASIEVKRGKKSGLWHPHAHALVVLSDWVNVKALSEEWEAVTGDSKITDVRRLRGGEDGAAGGLVKSFVEVFKYAVKFSDLSLPDNWEAFRVCRGRRLLRPWGEFWGVKVPERVTDELLPEDLPFVDLLFRYLRTDGKYILTEEKKNKPLTTAR